MSLSHCHVLHLFFFTAPAPTEIYTLSLHDALPISGKFDRLRTRHQVHNEPCPVDFEARAAASVRAADRKSTRLNSSHVAISYAVFCLKKKNAAHTTTASLQQDTASTVTLLTAAPPL